ncbi:MAG: ferredoxin--NADP reductase [Bordetella sp.]|nr:MAG: ferredoxin--NADP reductase [Bordetella sp.]
MKKKVTEKYTFEKIIDFHYWIPGKLITLYVTRNKDYTFQPGQFARIGIPNFHGDLNNHEILWRAYSIVNAPYDSYFEFYIIIIPSGKFSQKLVKLRPKDNLYVEKQSYGFLTLNEFIGGDTLWLIATGTGLSSYISILHDSKTWMQFKHVILIHGTREIKELTYLHKIEKWKNLISENNRFKYVPITTRESIAGIPQKRITTLLNEGILEKLVGKDLDPTSSRVMLCGNPNFIIEARKLLSVRGFSTGRRGNYGNLAIERYW